MKKITSCCLLGFLITALSPSAATAWMTSNRFGGSTTHTWGETSHTNMYGGSTQHAYGEGTQRRQHVARLVWGHHAYQRVRRLHVWRLRCGRLPYLPIRC